jgi:hypothetical protein
VENCNKKYFSKARQRLNGDPTLWPSQSLSSTRDPKHAHLHLQLFQPIALSPDGSSNSTWSWALLIELMERMCFLFYVQVWGRSSESTPRTCAEKSSAQKQPATQWLGLHFWGWWRTASNFHFTFKETSLKSTFKNFGKEE